MMSAGGQGEGSLCAALANQDTASVMSFHSSNVTSSSSQASSNRFSHHHLGTKVHMSHPGTPGINL